MGWDEGDADYTCVDTYVLYLRLVLWLGSSRGGVTV